MSTAISPVPHGGAWHGLKGRYVAAAAGIALAVAAITGAAVSIDGGGSPDARPLPPIAAPQSGGLPQLVFYIVGSAQEAARLEGSLASESWVRYEHGYTGPEITMQVLVADTPENERRAMEVVFNANAEAMQYGGATVSFVDMRPESAPID